MNRERSEVAVSRRGLLRSGVVLGSLFLGVIKNALPLVGISPFFQMAVSGAVITAAVLINARGTRRAPMRILERRTA